MVNSVVFSFAADSSRMKKWTFGPLLETDRFFDWVDAPPDLQMQMVGVLPL